MAARPRSTTDRRCHRTGVGYRVRKCQNWTPRLNRGRFVADATKMFYHDCLEHREELRFTEA